MNTTTTETTQQVYGAGQFETTTDDAARRVGRDISDLFATLRTLSRDEVEAALTQMRAAAEDLEVEMMGGEPEDDGRDFGRGYGREVR